MSRATGGLEAVSSFSVLGCHLAAAAGDGIKLGTLLSKGRFFEKLDLKSGSS